MNVPDNRPFYLSPAARVEQAKRLIPILEAEIAGGEKRQIFFELLEMHREYLEEGS